MGFPSLSARLSTLLLFLTSSLLYPVEAALPAGVNLLGRFDKDLRSDWPASGLTFSLSSGDDSSSGTLVSLELLDCVGDCRYLLEVLVDCEPYTVFDVKEGTSQIDFEVKRSSDPSSGNIEYHDVAIYKRTEASYSTATGYFKIGRLSVDNGAILTPDTMPPEEAFSSCQREASKLLIIGDSITCAYGVEGTSPCSFTPETENVLAGYAYLVAKETNSLFHTVSWSGKGVVRNYGDVNTTSPDPMPFYYNRTIAKTSDPAYYWDPRRYQPDVVVVQLGANDYSTEPHPSDEEFIGGYTDFLEVIRKDYPEAAVLLVCEYKLTEEQCANIEAVAKADGRAEYLRIDPNSVPTFGCDGHPSVESQRNLADQITPVVQSMLSTFSEA